jgi:hypothetical protein
LNLSCARNGNGYGGAAVDPGGPTQPAGGNHRLDILVSIENAATLNSNYAQIEKSLVNLTQTLTPTPLADYQISLYRSTEDQNGNYDSRAQGTAPVLRSSDPQLPTELHSDLTAMQTAHVGTLGRPVEILTEAAGDIRNSPYLRSDAQKFLLVFTTHDQPYAGDPNDAVIHYSKVFDWYWGVKRWRLGIVTDAGSTAPCLGPGFNFEVPMLFGLATASVSLCDATAGTQLGQSVLTWN